MVRHVPIYAAVAVCMHNSGIYRWSVDVRLMSGVQGCPWYHQTQVCDPNLDDKNPAPKPQMNPRGIKWCDEYMLYYMAPLQVSWNKCGESWMQGYCKLSCGRCSSGESYIAASTMNLLAAACIVYISPKTSHIGRGSLDTNVTFLYFLPCAMPYIPHQRTNI